MVVDTPESLKARLEAIQAREYAVRQDCLRVIHAVAVAALVALESGSPQELASVVAQIEGALEDGD